MGLGALEDIARVARAATEPLAPADRAAAVLEELGRIVPFDHAEIAAVDPFDGSRRLLANVGYADELLNHFHGPQFEEEIRSLDMQQEELAADARRLTALQAAAQDSQGQMQAIQAANQLASNQASQLMQIRALLIAQQTAEAARQSALADIEAQQEAASRQMRAGAFKKSVPYEW